MEDKCNKYEGYFLFSDERVFNEHLKNCPDCQREREREEKLSALIKDSKGEYQKLVKRNLKKIYAKIACVLVLFVGIGSTAGYNFYRNNCLINPNVYNSAYISVIENSGLPTDEYGFFDYN